MAADLGAVNPLPPLRQHPYAKPEIKLDENIPSEDRASILQNWSWRRVLPYQIQDGYNRDKKPTTFETIVLENDYLRATFWAHLGGRLISLYDKEQSRELLDANPVFQPASLGLRNAWFSGGIEWNPSNPGHHYHTCDPVFAARVEGPGGVPVLRLYEWDRVKRFPWQIDFYLPPDSRFLFARIRIVNPHEYELPMYWWTNMAVPEEVGSRVIAPTEAAIYNSAPGTLAYTSIPYVNGKDVSYPTNSKQAREFYFHVPDEQRRWIASLDREGTGFVQTSTDQLMGRKLFVWGMSTGGRRWQEYLSEPGRAYCEIQAGLTKTQFETLPMPAKTELAWTEAFGYLHADPEKVHSTDWQDARRAVEETLEASLPKKKLEQIDKALLSIAARKPDQLLNTGSGWGALERLRSIKQNQPDLIPPEFVFEKTTLGPEQQPWVKLLETGKLPQMDADQAPPSWMIQKEWGELLRQSAQTAEGDTWLAWLHLGLVEHEALNPEAARAAWNRSIELTPNVWAYRNLGAMEASAWKPVNAREYYERAWSVGPQVAPLAEEYLGILRWLNDHAAMDRFIRTLPSEIQDRERVHIFKTLALLELEQLEEIEELFEREFVTIREGEETLTDIWFRYHVIKLARSQDRPADEALLQKVRSELTPPAHIDYRMFSEPE